MYKYPSFFSLYQVFIFRVKNHPFGSDVVVSLDPPKDGSCQFACLEEQLKAHGFTWLQESLRCELTKFILNSDQSFITEAVPDRDVKKYVDQMNKRSTFGDNFTLVAAAKRFSVQILVLSSQGDDYNRFISPDSNEVLMKEYPTILLGYYAENSGAHYVNLRPIEEQHNMESIFDRRYNTRCQLPIDRQGIYTGTSITGANNTGVCGAAATSGTDLRSFR